MSFQRDSGVTIEPGVGGLATRIWEAADKPKTKEAHRAPHATPAEPTGSPWKHACSAS